VSPALRLDAGGDARPSRFASLRGRNFRLFLGGQLVSSIGTWLHQLAEVWLMLEVTDSGFAVGCVVAARFIPVLTMGLWGGAIADRHSKRTVLYVTQSVRAVAALALGIAALGGAASAALILALAVVGGAANAVDNPVRRALISELVGPETIMNAVSLNSTVMATSRVVGPLLAGGLIATVGVGWCFVVNGMSYVAVLVALRAMRLADRPALVADRRSGGVRAGLAYAAGDRAIWVPLLMVALVSASAWNWETLLALLARDELDGGPGLFTALFAVLSAGTFLGAMANSRRSTAGIGLLVGTASFTGVAMLAVGVVPGLPAAVVALAAAGAGAAMFNTASNSLLQLAARGAFHGRVMAIFSALFVGTKGVGGAVAGAVSSAFGARVGVVVGGCGCLGAAAAGQVLSTRRTAVAAPDAPVGRVGRVGERWHP